MITEHDKVRARGHTGYGGVQQSSTFVLGVPAGVQTAFMIEGAWERLLPSMEAEFSKLLDKLDRVECQIEENMEDLAVTKIGDIEINKTEFEQLVQRYQYWQGKLCNLLQVPPNPFDQRWNAWGGASGSINVSVTG